MPGRSVLVVDDHEGFRTSARAWLTSEGFTVVGESPTGEDALRDVGDLMPDLVLLDLNLPGMSGLDVAAELAASAGGPAVIIISSDAEAGSDPLVQAAPVAGFLAKRDLACDAIDTLLA